MTANKARKRATRTRAAEAGISYTAAHFENTAPRPVGEQRPEWAGIDWYAFPPEPPRGCRLGVLHANQRYYWTIRRRWASIAPEQVQRQAHSAADPLRRAQHLAGWWPEGLIYFGRTRDVALSVLYTIAMHDWPDLVPNAEVLAELAAAGEPAPVDAAFAELDRHARLLAGDQRHAPTVELVEQARTILQTQAADTSDPRRRRHAEIALANIRRALTPYDVGRDGYPIAEGIAMPGALATLDAMLCSSQGGFPPGTVVSCQDGGRRVLAEIDRCRWAPAGGGPTHYDVHWFGAPGEVPHRAEQLVTAEDVQLPSGTAAPWMTRL
ncbi:hypothetical protein [Amycolatopsis eburnea]|uniref:Uncharacterized protein n=1 Tax=Amycolatopsis eburnea TaxID=2267691 RepID=A0A3R9KUD3_9PSEU|nr:hypothetical protein [Amycolatopsis eburnea]RSD26416.1 hypothetical protein EIY87_00050 [Amycolatopsis eburnea]